MKIRAIGVLATALLCVPCACSGGSQVVGTLQPVPKIPTRPLQVTYTIPKASAVSTKSIAIAADGIAVGVFDTTAASSGCGTLNGATVCSFTSYVPLGPHVLHITGFDQTAGGGRTICSANVMVGILPQRPASLHIALGGVVTNASIGIPDAGLAGTAATAPVVVMAQDAAGNVLIGPERFSTPIVVTDQDKSGATSLSLNNAAPASVVHVAKASDSVTLLYNGGNVTTAIINANPGPSAAPAVATYSPIANVVATYPMPVINGQTTAPNHIAKGSDGNVWVSYLASNFNGFAKMTPGGAFTVFPNSSSARDVVDAMVTAAPGSAAAIWFTAGTSNGEVAGNISANGAVTEYPFPAQSCGNQTVGVQAIVSDGTTGYWIAMSCPSSTQLAHVTANGVFTLSPQFPQLFVDAMILGSDGKLYLAGQDNGNNKALVAQVSVNGSQVTNVATLDTDAITWAWGAIAQTPNGDLWLTYFDTHLNASVGRVQIAPSFSNSSVALYTEHKDLGSIVALPDNSVWIDANYSPNVEHITGGTDPSAILSLQTLPLSSLSHDCLLVGSAVGGDGDVYFAGTVDPYTGSIVKVAY